jgi:putative transposase
MRAGAALSRDLRTRIVATWEKGELTWDQIAEKFSVGRATVDRLIRLYRETKEVTPRPHGGGTPPKISDEKLPIMREILEAHPDATLEELAAMYSKRSRVTVGPMCVYRAAKKLGFTRKKRVWSPPSATVRRSRRAGPSSSSG